MSGIPAVTAGGHRAGCKHPPGRNGSGTDASGTESPLASLDADAGGNSSSRATACQSGSSPQKLSRRSEARLDGSPPQQQSNSLAAHDLNPGQFVTRSEKTRSGVVAISFGRLESARSETLPLETQISAATGVSVPGSTADDTVSRHGSWWQQLGEAAAGKIDMPAAHARVTDLLLHKPDASDFLDEETEVQRLHQSPEFLAEHEADPGFTLLHFVALLGQSTLADASGTSRRAHHRFARMAECLIRKHRHEVYVLDKYGCTPLQLAATVGNLEMVKVLLAPYDFQATSDSVLASMDRRYAYLNHQDHQIRFTPLHGAVNHGQHDVVITLLRHGANPQVLDNTRLTAFKVAPSLTSLQKLLRLVLRHADEVPREVIVQLMADMLALQSECHAAIMWTKAGKFVAATKQSQSQGGEFDALERFGTLALEVMGGGQHADVSTTVQRYFKQLYNENRANVILEYVLTALHRNHGSLTELLIDVICAHTPHVLLAPRWHETLEPLATSFPATFHRLLANLQDMRDDDVRGFVRCLSPSKFEEGAEERSRAGLGAALLSSRRMDDAAAAAAAATAASAVCGGTAGSGGMRGGGGGNRTHAADRVKLLIYQQLVEGLKKVSYRIVKTFFEQSDQRLLNDMAHFPIFAEFVGLVAEMDTGKAAEESDSSRQLLLEFLRPGDGAQGEEDDGGEAVLVGDDSCSSTTSRRQQAATALTGVKAAGAVNGTSDGSGLQLHASSCAAPAGSKAAAIVKSPPEGDPAARAVTRPRRATACLSDYGSSVHVLAGPPHGPGRKAHGGKQPQGRMAAGAAAERWSARSFQTLNVRRVLHAAVSAGKADNVEAAVEGVVGWVQTNSLLDRKAVFLAGITADLIKALATRFPSACATLLNLVSKDVLEQLATLQVPANVLYGRDHLVKCSHVHNYFTWREQELRRLRKVRGYSEHVVDALVDYGVPFECVYKAAVELGGSPNECATPEQFATLIEHGFTGPELKQLISNGIRLAKVIGYIEECEKPLPPGVPPEFKEKLDVSMSVLLRDMLRERLSPRIVDIILREEKMFETTKYNNFRPGCELRHVYPEPLFLPTYTHHFVQVLLINWRRRTKSSHGKVREPWAKEFIDTVFEPNDPLCTKLKSAYDNKLTDTHVYIQGDSDDEALELPAGGCEAAVKLARQERERALRERQQEHEQQVRHVRHLLSIFVSKPLLLHRWPVFLAAHLGLLLQSAGYTYWQRLEDLYLRGKERRFGHLVNPVQKARLGTIDAAVLVFPLLSFFQIGREDMLTALVDSDAPSSWFHFPVVRALYTVHWSMFGSVLVYLNAAVQLQFAACFLTTFLLVLNCDTEDTVMLPSGEMVLKPLVDKPCVMVMLCVCVLFSATMLLERAQEAQVPRLASWVTLGRQLELSCHAMVWVVALIVWTSTGANLVPALSGLTMLLFVARLTLFGLITDKLSTAVLALLEILSDSRYFFLLISTVYGGFILAVAGLRQDTERDPRVYSTQLFTVLLGDFTSDKLTSQDAVWRYPGVSLVLLSSYAILMLIVFMNLLIATMNDTYDRVKEFCEVEVMRLRSHMMVFVKDFMERSAQEQRLEPLTGEALHLLMRPEAVKSSRLLTLSSADPSASGDHGSASPWVGRITYMRSSIVRDVSEVIRQRTDAAATSLAARLERVEEDLMGMAGERLLAVEHRMERLEAGMEALLEALARQHGDGNGRGGGGGCAQSSVGDARRC